MTYCLVLDIGKTNKKAFVIDDDYRIVFEKTARFEETIDDDGDPCEDISLLKNWVEETVTEICSDPRFNIRAANCTAYGASFVHLDEQLQPVAPLYNYLKPFPEDLLHWFLEKYGGAEKLSLETASPLLGHLNSGLQLLWLKHRKSLIFKKIKYSLHLPQWIAQLMSARLGGGAKSVGFGDLTALGIEMTSVGCHTMLWDFQKNDYHVWVKTENIVEKFSPALRASSVPEPSERAALHIGAGLHDSSAALLPCLTAFEEPFVLISTGTWCISLNPFNTEPLTAAELAQDCLCYLTPAGRPVKAARYFGGHEHEVATQQIAATHSLSADFYKNIDAEKQAAAAAEYTRFMAGLLEKQISSTRLAIGQSGVRRIFVDGGFSKNALYMRGLAANFSDLEVYAAEVAQATALGAALAVHAAWNNKPVRTDLIAIKKYEATEL
jgi:sugar (pentulose or hexulose) kinase